MCVWPVIINLHINHFVTIQTSLKLCFVRLNKSNKKVHVLSCYNSMHQMLFCMISRKLLRQIGTRMDRQIDVHEKEMDKDWFRYDASIKENRFLPKYNILYLIASFCPLPRLLIYQSMLLICVILYISFSLHLIQYFLDVIFHAMKGFICVM